MAEVFLAGKENDSGKGRHEKVGKKNDKIKIFLLTWQFSDL